MMKWNVWNGHLAFVLVSLVWSYFAAVQRLAIKVVEGNEVVENLISMISGEKNHVLLLLYVHFYLKAGCRMMDLKRLYIYISAEGDGCTRIVNEGLEITHVIMFLFRDL